MGRRFYNSRYPKYGSEDVPNFSRYWWGKNYGRWLKRRYSKVMRIAGKRECRELHIRKSPIGVYSEMNWKGW